MLKLFQTINGERKEVHRIYDTYAIREIAHASDPKGENQTVVIVQYGTNLRQIVVNQKYEEVVFDFEAAKAEQEAKYDAILEHKPKLPKKKAPAKKARK